MAKNPIPKKVAGLKIPRSLRKSKTLRRMLAHPLGREIVANALTAGAGAAAAALISNRDEIGAAASRSGRKLGVVGEAIADGAGAMMSVLRDAAHSHDVGGRKKSRQSNPARH